MPISELFGFLTYPNSIEFNGGLIKPTDSFQKNLEKINRIKNSDGFLYPPELVICTKEEDLETGQMDESRFAPNSRKPSPVFPVKKSHILHIDNPLNKENIRFEDAGLLIHLLGFFFETRLQFSDWRLDGKVPIKPHDKLHNISYYSPDTLSHFISSVYQKWKTLTPEQRKYYINILYMHGKARSCEWEWDEFIYQYMVFDAIYRFYVMLGNSEIKGHKAHKKRLIGLCQHFNIIKDDSILEQIYKLRNDLFHEALWCGETLGLKKTQEDSHLIVKCLERLNFQLIIAIMGYQNNYAMSASWFDLYFRGEIFDKFNE